MQVTRTITKMHAHCQQVGFDELSSNIPFDQAFIKEAIDASTCEEGPRIKTVITVLPAGIDDYLAHYTLQPRSIRDFISCLNEPDAENSVHESKAVHEDITPKGESSQHSAKAFPTSIISSNEKQQVKEAAQPTEKRKSSKAQPAIICKKAKLTPEEKEERRREQNREAQRRFRERHMLQPYRMSFSQHGWAHEPNFPPRY